MIRRLYMHFIWIAIIVIGLGSVHAWANNSGNYAIEPDFHKVEAKKGDGIFSLLRRYNLNVGSCNMNKFLELNKLKSNDALVIGNSYFIPVLIYKYNGSSIRSTIGNNDMDKALRIKSYNDFLLAQNLRKTAYSDSKILWVPYNEVSCTTTNTAKEEKLIREVNGRKIYEPLFGIKLAEVLVEDQSLKNRVFYVVSGHGGPDPGAQCTDCSNTMCEDEYAYDVALRLSRNLMQHGAIVHIVIQDANDGIRSEAYLDCDTDERSINKKILPLNQKKRLKQRTDDINRLFASHKRAGVKSQTVISIHVDSRSKSKSQDVFFYHLKGSKSGKKIATSLHKTFERKYNQFQRGRGYKGTVSHRGLYLLRNTYPTAVFVELANIRNKYDHRRLIFEENRQALANWLYEGLRDGIIK